MEKLLSKESPIAVRKSAERGQAKHGWLTSQHTFSFADYYDQNFMGFRSLRVINEDRVEPGQGFGTHPHSDMEIITYVISGAVAHKDSMGNVRVVNAGELQAMSAGTGITHSEYNASSDQPVHFLQIWIMPEKRGLAPSYGEWREGDSAKKKSELIASKNGVNGSLIVNQDVNLFLGNLSAGEQSEYLIRAGRFGWIQVIEGAVNCLGEQLNAGDGAAIGNIEKFLIEVAEYPAKYLFFDLA